MRGSRLPREIAEYVESQRERGVTIEYIWNLEGLLRTFRKYCEAQGIGCVSRITVGTVSSYLEEKQKYSAAYMRKMLSAIRTLLAYHKNIELLSYKPRIFGAGVTKRDRMTLSEATAIFRTPMDLTERVIIGGALLQGLRGTEIMRMRVSDVERSLKDKVLPIRGKTGPRSIPLQEDYELTLTDYLNHIEKDDNDLLLGFKRNKLRKILQEFSSRHGKKVGLRNMRRTFGYVLWSKGVPLETIMQFYGHQNLSMSRHYLCLDLAEMTEALSKLQLVEKSEKLILLAR